MTNDAGQTLDAFDCRGVVITPQDFVGVDWIALARELGLNTLGMHSGDGVGVDTLGRLGTTVDTTFRDKARLAGLRVEYELHAMATLLPRALFQSHPDFFAFDSERAQRIADYNFCPSNPEAMDRVVASAVALARTLRPDTNRFYFWSDDGKPWCACPSCARLSESEQELLVANHIAAALRTDYDPEAQVAFLAYARSAEPPVRVQPHEGVFLEFAPFHRDLGFGIADPSCPANRELWSQLRRLLELFPPERTHVLEYWLDSSLVSKWRKPARKLNYDRGVVESDLQAYRQLGLRSITTFAVYLDRDYFDRFGYDDVRHYGEAINALVP